MTAVKPDRWTPRLGATLLLCLLSAHPAWGVPAVELWPEYVRSAPSGAVVPADRNAAPEPVPLTGGRGGYVSFQLVAKLPEGGPYSLDLRIDGAAEADVFRQWYHRMENGDYYPDALIPVSLPFESRLPEPDNRIEEQTAQAFWVDVWIKRDAPPGVVSGQAVLRAGGREAALPITIEILEATVPEGDALTIDHNSYGSSWLAGFYQRPGESSQHFFASDRFFGLIHAHHRLFYEHRGTFHQLGYGHAGKVGPEFAPRLAGSGRNKAITDWELFDRHYGPLLDGSAFAGTRRGARPIPFVYLPINPEWPASFLWWGEPGYEAEFTRVVAAMEKHFREKGWTRTRFELFFNHKKRYKGFPWDGDETRFAADNAYFKEYRRLLREALPAGTPVRFVFRNDASWMMEKQFDELAGVIDFWVLGRGILSWYPDAPKRLRARGDIVWFYGGAPKASEVSSAATRHPLTAWVWGLDGYIHWLTVSPGEDPWFRFGGGETALVYPGVRFGIDGPIPGIRLKIQRNCLQDLALLNALHAPPGEVTNRYNRTRPEDWWTPRPPLADRPPHEWSNTDIGEAADLDQRLFRQADPKAWQRVREYAFELARRRP